MTMSKTETLLLQGTALASAWAQSLPTVLNSSDRAEAWADEAQSNVVRVRISTAGHSGYSFDFKCTYMDSREVKVELVDVERGGINVDERTETIQSLIDDYVRHLHECAQQLHHATSGG